MTNEPTTGEIVRALRTCLENDDIECAHCICSVSESVHLCDLVELASRLESQERKIAGKDVKIKQLELQRDILAGAVKEMEEPRTFSSTELIITEPRDELIAALTARAESAERERDALISSIERLRTKKIELCSICEFEDLIACCHKDRCEGYQLFKRCGQPQEGEGK